MLKRYRQTRIGSKIVIHQYTMCDMVKLHKERSGALLGNWWVNEVRIHANIYKSFKAYANGSMQSRMIWSRLNWRYDETNTVVGAETTKNTKVKWTSQDKELSSPCGVWRNAVYLWAIGMFLWPNFNFKKRNCWAASFQHLPVDSFSSDQIVCSLGEPFHTKQPDYFILRMIISSLFEPFRNSSRDHLRLVCAIWHDCIFGGNGRLYRGFWVVLSLWTLYFWLAGKTKTKQVVNRMSEWVEGGGSWKG